MALKFPHIFMEITAILCLQVKQNKRHFMSAGETKQKAFMSAGETKQKAFYVYR